MKKVCQRNEGLETFLGGMEIIYSARHCGTACHPLKPSLVEWKLLEMLIPQNLRSPLKPSLVEWKLVLQVVLGEGVPALKPSLVEWK